MEAIIQRLKEEKACIEKDSFKNGKTKGRIWAKSASYSDFIYALKYDYNYKDRWVTSSILDDNVVGEYFKGAFEEDHFMAVKPHDPCLNYYAASWVKGWFDGVRDIWSTVEDKI